MLLPTISSLKLVIFSFGFGDVGLKIRCTTCLQLSALVPRRSESGESFSCWLCFFFFLDAVGHALVLGGKEATGHKSFKI
jgi:hypothetical protein